MFDLHGSHGIFTSIGNRSALAQLNGSTGPAVICFILLLRKIAVLKIKNATTFFSIVEC